MGLGKTLTAIALIQTDPTGAGLLEKASDLDERYSDATLIICPLSVIGNWIAQIRTHTAKKLKVHVYHGDGRSISRQALRNMDVVISTYQTLSSEWISDEAPAKKKRKVALNADGEPKQGKLHRIAWRRCVLDEGHTIRNVRHVSKRRLSGSCASSPRRSCPRPVTTSTPNAGGS
jgi:SWI/SNF-related matrix-associated actin-dependent regulator of chromatin subfamily A3